MLNLSLFYIQMNLLHLFKKYEINIYNGYLLLIKK